MCATISRCSSQDFCFAVPSCLIFFEARVEQYGSSLLKYEKKPNCRFLFAVSNGACWLISRHLHLWFELFKKCHSSSLQKSIRQALLFHLVRCRPRKLRPLVHQWLVRMPVHQACCKTDGALHLSCSAWIAKDPESFSIEATLYSGVLAEHLLHSSGNSQFKIRELLSGMGTIVYDDAQHLFIDDYGFVLQ